MDEREWRVLDGVGLVLVQSVDDDLIEIWEDPDDDDDSYREAADDLAEVLRPLISPSRAEAIIERLASPFPDEAHVAAEQRLRSYQAAFEDGSIDALVGALHRLYNTPDVSAAERSNIDRLEAALFPEIAQVLGTSPRSLRNRARRRTGDRVVPPPVEMPDRSPELDREVLPDHDGWKPIGAFAVDAAIVAGDRPPLRARSGLWHAWYRIDDEFEMPCAVVVAHRAVSAEVVTLLGRTVRDDHRVLGGRGSMDVCDAAVAEDRDWLAARFDAPALSIVEGRGFWVYTESDDDDHPGLVLEDGVAVLLHITAT